MMQSSNWHVANKTTCRESFGRLVAWNGAPASPLSTSASSLPLGPYGSPFFHGSAATSSSLSRRRSSEMSTQFPQVPQSGDNAADFAHLACVATETPDVTLAVTEQLLVDPCGIVSQRINKELTGAIVLPFLLTLPTTYYTSLALHTHIQTSTSLPSIYYLLV